MIVTKNINYELSFLDSGLTTKVGKNIPERGHSIYNKQKYGLFRKPIKCWGKAGERDLQEEVTMRAEA